MIVLIILWFLSGAVAGYFTLLRGQLYITLSESFLFFLSVMFGFFTVVIILLVFLLEDGRHYVVWRRKKARK